MDTHQLFSVESSRYAVARPQYPDSLFDYLADLCEETDSVWDCATGSGQAAISLAKHFDSVQATDVSAEQIANAFAQERVCYSVQPAEKTNFETASFDLITVATALHWFDLEHFWPEVHRVLKPKGIFAAWGYNWPRVNDVIDQIVHESLVSIIEPYWAPNNLVLWQRYENISFPFEEISPPKMAMTQAWTLYQFLN